MKLALFLTFGAVAVTSLVTPAANADTYSTVTTESGPLMETRTTRSTETLESPPAVIEERPVIVTPPATHDTIIVKKRSHHLIKVGPVKVF